MSDALPKGTRVEIIDLASRPELNGQCATVKTYDKAKKRYGCKLDSGDSMSLKAEKLRVIDDTAAAEPSPKILESLPEAAAPAPAPAPAPSTPSPNLGPALEAALARADAAESRALAAESNAAAAEARANAEQLARLRLEEEVAPLKQALAVAKANVEQLRAQLAEGGATSGDSRDSLIADRWVRFSQKVNADETLAALVREAEAYKAAADAKAKAAADDLALRMKLGLRK